MLRSSFSIALFSGVFTFALLFLIIQLIIIRLLKNKNKFLNYLKEVLKNKYSDLWEREYKNWFKAEDDRFYKEIKKRKYKSFTYIFFVGANIFLLIYLFGNLFTIERKGFFHPALVPLPILFFTLFCLITIFPILAGRDNNKSSGTIGNKINMSLYIIFPRIKKSLIFFTNEPIPYYFGDPRIIESLYYLKYVKKINSIKIYCYFPDFASKDYKDFVIESIINPYKEKGLFEILHFLDKRIDFQHFLIGDNSIVRIEKKHSPWIKKYPAWTRSSSLEYSFPNKTFYFNPVLAMELKSFLESVKGYDVGGEYTR